MEESIRSLYTWKTLRTDVHNHCKHCKHCKTCQLFKTTSKKKYGLLPAKLAEVIKWSRVNVDCWGPKTVKNKNGTNYTIHVLTMIDPVTGWFEVAALQDNPNANEIQRLFDSHWLARYPRPVEIGFDNGSEFKMEFQDLCKNMGLTKKTSLPWNPQSNSILERVHQVLGDCLRTFNLDNKELNPDHPFEEFLTASAYAIRCAYHTTLGFSPAQLVFGRDMFMPIETPVDWEQIRIRKQNQINKDNVRENSKRTPHDYAQGDLITIKRPGIIPKLSIPRMGPYKVTQTHNNGTVTIQKQPFVTERVNQRRIRPFYTKQ